MMRRCSNSTTPTRVRLLGLSGFNARPPLLFIPRFVSIKSCVTATVRSLAQVFAQHFFQVFRNFEVGIDAVFLHFLPKLWIDFDAGALPLHQRFSGIAVYKFLYAQVAKRFNSGTDYKTTRTLVVLCLT